MTDALEEHGHVDAGPGSTQVDAEIVTGLAVADDLVITAVVHLLGAPVDDTVFVEVSELHVAGAESGRARNGIDGTRAGVDDAVHLGLVHGGGPGGRGLVGREQAQDVVTPDVTVLLALPVVLREELVGVVEAGDVGNVVAEQHAGVIEERLAAQHEGILPADVELVTHGTEVGDILLRGAAVTVGGGEHLAGGEHVLGVTDIAFCREVEAAVQEGQVDTRVLLDGTLPGQAGGNRSGNGGQSRLGAAQQIGGLGARGDGTDGGIVIAHLLVTQLTIGETELGVVPPGTERSEEGFLADSPTQGDRRGEDPAAAAEETGRTVITAVHFQEVTVLVVIVETGEIAGRLDFVLAAGNFHPLISFLVRTGQVEVVQFEGIKVVADGFEILDVTGLIVDTGHQLQVVGFIPGGRIGRIQVGGLVRLGVHRLRQLVLESRTGVHGLDDTGIGGVLAGHRTVLVAGNLEGVGEVALDRHTLEGLDGHIDGIAEIIDLVGVVVTVGQRHHQTVHQGVAVVGGLVEGRAVRVEGRIAGRGMGGRAVQRVVDAAAARIEVGAVEIAQVFADTQPLGDVEAHLRADVIPVIVVGVDVEHTLLVGVTAGNQVVHMICSAARGNGVARGRLDVLVQDMPPVGVRVIIIDVFAGLVLADDHPRTLGILHLVIAAVPKFHHVRLGIVVQVGAVVGVHEQVAQIDGVVTAGLPVGGSRRSGETGAAGVGERRLSVLRLGAALGRDQDHARGTSRTVDGRRGGILDDGDALYVGGVEVLEVALHTVHQYERVAAVDGIAAADVDRGGLAGTSGSGSDVQARDGTLQHVTHIQRGTVLEIVGLDDGHGARQVGLLRGTVTDDDGIFQHVIVFLEQHHDLLASLDGNLLRLIAQAGDLEDSVGVDGDGEGAIRVGDCAGTLGHHGRPDDGTGRIRHCTAHRYLLGVCAKRDDHTHQYGQYAEQFLRKHTIVVKTCFGFAQS